MDGPELLRVHLRGGQTIEMVVTDWGVKKSPVDNSLTELRWAARDGDRMPYLRFDAVDAVTAGPVPAEEG